MPAPRIHVDRPLAPGAEFALGSTATRHVQVLRMQPGETLTLFDGSGGQWAGVINAISRREVRVRTLHFDAMERELACAVTLAVGMPANERMDALVEKATELGVSRIQPLVCERSVLRVAGDRAVRKASHWRAVAIAACEQCGRNRVPEVAEPLRLGTWLDGLGGQRHARWLLSTATDAAPWPPATSGAAQVFVLSGPEGGLAAAEEAAARAAGFAAFSLGVRVLRADTAPLAALAWIALDRMNSPHAG